MRRGALLALVAWLGLTAPAGAGDLVRVDPKAVDFVVRDREGREIALPGRGSAEAPRLTLVHFWATWCGSCRTEFPEIDALQRDLGGRGVRVAAVSIDRLGWPAIDRLVESLGIAHVGLFHDVDRRAAQAAGIVGLPTTLVVDGEGREVARVIGAGAWSDPTLRATLEGFAKP